MREDWFQRQGRMFPPPPAVFSWRSHRGRDGNWRRKVDGEAAVEGMSCGDALDRRRGPVWKKVRRTCFRLRPDDDDDYYMMKMKNEIKM